MELKPCKIKAYIGFAIKSRSIKFGVDDIIKCKKTQIVLYSDLLAKSSEEKLLKFATENRCETFKLNATQFDELFDENSNVKAVAILDKNLAVAIKKNMTE